MKHPAFTRSFALLAALTVPAAALAQPSQALRLEMRVARPQGPLGASVAVTVRVVAVSAAAREVLARRGFEPVKLAVSRGGRTLPDIAATSLSTELERLRVARVRPAPGCALELDTDLSYWALLDRPGRYDVVVEFAPGTSNVADAGFAPVRSPGISVTVQNRPAAEITKQVGELARRLASAQGPARGELVRGLGASRSAAALTPLVAELHGADELGLRWAPAALGLLPDRAAVIAAVRQALAGRGPSGAVVEVLLRAGDPAAGLGDAARASLQGRDAPRRRLAADALAVLARRATGEARRPLLDALLALQSDRDAAIRMSVVFGVDRMDDPRALAALEAAGRDASATVRAAAVRALRERRARASLTALLAAATSDALQVARALAAIADPEAKRTLSQCLAVRALPMRLACAEALWEVDDRSGRGVLLQALRTRDDALRAAVIDWLTVATGRAEPATGIADLAIAWTRWLQQVR